MCPMYSFAVKMLYATTHTFSPNEVQDTEQNI